jgi:membrane-associated progesterone receptor component
VLGGVRLPRLAVRMGAAYELLVGTALGVGIIVVLNLIKFILHRGEALKLPAPLKIKIGFITEETLKTYAGYDITKPLLIAVRGKLYDVGKSRDKYGPGRL